MPPFGGVRDIGSSVAMKSSSEDSSARTLPSLGGVKEIGGSGPGEDDEIDADSEPVRVEVAGGPRAHHWQLLLDAVLAKSPSPRSAINSASSLFSPEIKSSKSSDTVGTGNTKRAPRASSDSGVYWLRGRYGYKFVCCRPDNRFSGVVWEDPALAESRG